MRSKIYEGPLAATFAEVEARVVEVAHNTMVAFWGDSGPVGELRGVSVSGTERLIAINNAFFFPGDVTNSFAFRIPESEDPVYTLANNNLFGYENLVTIVGEGSSTNITSLAAVEACPQTECLEADGNQHGADVAPTFNPDSLMPDDTSVLLDAGVDPSAYPIGPSPSPDLGLAVRPFDWPEDPNDGPSTWDIGAVEAVE